MRERLDPDYPQTARETMRPYHVWDEKANGGRGADVPHRYFRWALNAHKFAAADVLFGDGRILTVYSVRDGRSRGTYRRAPGGGVSRTGYRKEW